MPARSETAREIRKIRGKIPFNKEQANSKAQQEVKEILERALTRKRQGKAESDQENWLISDQLKKELP